jgi:hypothetical protein
VTFPKVIRHRKPATKADAEKWWAVAPAIAGNVIPPPAAPRTEAH